jgi:hypothetical protein
MKKKTLLGISLIALLCVVGWTVAPASATAENSHESAELKVLKVFSARDGDAVFRAYMVSWKGQEVVVPDTLAKTDYRVGDTATVLVMNHDYPKGKAGPRLLHFEILANKKIR